MYPTRTALTLLFLAACSGGEGSDTEPATGNTASDTEVATSSDSEATSDTEASRPTAYQWAGVLGGTQGDGDGELANPYDICLGGGQIFVTEGNNDRISVFTTDGTFVTHLLEDEVSTPKGCLYEDGTLWVADHDAGRIYQVDPDSGEVLKGIGGFDTPFDLDRGPDGQLWVTDYTADQVVRVDETSTLTVLEASFDAPSGILTVGDQVWVGDTLNDRVVVLDADGDAVTSYPGELQLDDPHHLALSPDGEAVWISDQLNNRVQRWDLDGQREVVLGGTEGSGDEELFWPFGVAVSEDGEVFVGDLRNHRVARWTPED